MAKKPSDKRVRASEDHTDNWLLAGSAPTIGLTLAALSERDDAEPVVMIAAQLRVSPLYQLALAALSATGTLRYEPDDVSVSIFAARMYLAGSLEGARER